MATEELVTEQFQFLGIDVQEEVLTKCVSLCEEYNVDAETFIEQWMAFSLTHLNGSPPTLENLELLEKREFSKATASRPNAFANDATSTGTSLSVYGMQVSAQPDNQLLSDYMTTSPKQFKVENVPVSGFSEINAATISDTIGKSAKYAARTNPGAVVNSYGSEELLQVLAKANGPNDILELCITQVPNDDREIYTKAMFGFELLHEKASTFDNHIHYVSRCILKKASLSECTSVRQKSQTEVIVAGRIECDADARLNSKSVVLQGTWEESLSQAVAVDIDNPFTKIYIVSNCKDVFHLNIYPTPPYPSSKRKHPNIHFLPDPCTLNLSGVVVGITGIDVLMHISQEEISQGVGGDKLARLANHLLMQQTYYPLWPPPPGLCLDAALWSAHAQMPCTPHILVLPSNFRYFIKEINGCVVVNPERLSKGQGGGTFAKAVVSNDTASPKNIAAQIIRI
ncbi:DNA polymerase alpha subunit B isoform X4 [Battus philenor]|uniref:DNA polymerase alpha subunit B isoform X4 n=1 Tax=Battus philenor TaxID=42288 RepID=UPI0035CF4DE1